MKMMGLISLVKRLDKVTGPKGQSVATCDLTQLVVALKESSGS